ncbi:C-type lectin domain family 4 member E-like [Brachyhypopomus gauderio]|uniref:C-type lectin domain family 4 member E-like n=1 Tax=Brachyhypopomus gauderio TaxID=698409 RepID=UPI004041CC7C
MGNIWCNSSHIKGSYEDVYVNDVTRREKKTSGGDVAGSRCSRLTAVCLGLLCVLLLTVIIVMWVMFTAETDQLQTRYNNLTIERDQLQTNNYNLTMERDQLQTSYLTTVRDQLQTSYNNIFVERDQLLMERAVLQKELSVLGWKYFNFSIYFLTTGRKSWTESRKECKQNGSDLVIVNSREEQEFISKMFPHTEAWIGLSDTNIEGNWKWVDNTPLTSEYWWKQEPNDYGGNEDCAITGYKTATDSVLTWADYPCQHHVVGICEKMLI